MILTSGRASARSSTSAGDYEEMDQFDRRRSPRPPTALHAEDIGDGIARDPRRRVGPPGRRGLDLPGALHRRSTRPPENSLIKAVDPAPKQIPR
jgi:hypothetical protein